MEPEMLKINTLSIAIFGLLVFLVGLVLYIFRDSLSTYIRFILPIPPISVAAYIFVFNMFRHYGGHLPETFTGTTREILLSTGISAILFGTFTILLAILVHFAQRIVR
jgi:hypothetical protein